MGPRESNPESHGFADKFSVGTAAPWAGCLSSLTSIAKSRDNAALLQGATCPGCEEEAPWPEAPPPTVWLCRCSLGRGEGSSFHHQGPLTSSSIRGGHYHRSPLHLTHGGTHPITLTRAYTPQTLLHAPCSGAHTHPQTRIPRTRSHVVILSNLTLRHTYKSHTRVECM